MSGCSIFTAERLELLLAGRSLPEAERAALCEHLAAPCEACLDTLGSIEGERILAALAGPQAELSVSEADRVFAAALPAPESRPVVGEAAASSASPSLWERFVEWLGGASWRPALGVALLLVNAAPALWLGMHGPPGSSGYDGIKGEPTAGPVIKASLIGVIGGRFHGKPFMSRRAAMNEQMRPGEVLLVRFRLQGGEAAVHLEISGPKARLGVWADGRPDTEPQPKMLSPGSHALVANGQVLAVRAEEYGSPVKVVFVASPQPFPAELVGSLGRIGEDPAALSSRCPGCVAETLEVLPPPEGVEPAPEWKWE
ncbi:MAG: hypothetical protein HY901_18625 [Deltaproteobacteria bacterium]|nr:hypothetical protein [Deltaproteobacteria bacterium]